jgi:hypothetical protein
LLTEAKVKETVSLTLNEAGYVVGQSSTAINRAVNRGVIKARLQRRGKAAQGRPRRAAFSCRRERDREGSDASSPQEDL